MEIELLYCIIPRVYQVLRESTWLLCEFYEDLDDDDGFFIEKEDTSLDVGMIIINEKGFFESIHTNK